MAILRNSMTFVVFTFISFISWFFGDVKFVLVVNNITQRKCNTKGHSKKMQCGVHMNADIVET